MTKIPAAYRSTGPATNKLSDFVDPDTMARLQQIGRPEGRGDDTPNMPGERTRTDSGRLREVRADQHVGNNPTLNNRHKWLVNGLEAAGVDMTVGQLRSAASAVMGREMSMSAVAKLPKAQVANLLGVFFARQEPAVSAAIQSAYQGFAMSEGAPLASVYDLPEAAPATPAAIQRKLPEGWSGRTSTFELGALPDYHPDTVEALDLAYAWDKAGDPKTAIGVYEQVLTLEPENPDAHNRMALAQKHLAEQMVAKTAKHNESPNVRREAIRTMEQAVAGFEAVVARGVEAGVYDPARNTLGFSNPDALMGRPEREGLLKAVPKALYNLAVAQMSLAELKGEQPLANDAVLAGFSRAAQLTSSLAGDAAQTMIRNSSWSGSDPFTQDRNAQMARFVQDAASFTQSVGPQLEQAFLQDGDLTRALHSDTLKNAIQKPGAFG